MTPTQHEAEFRVRPGFVQGDTVRVVVWCKPFLGRKPGGVEISMIMPSGKKEVQIIYGIPKDDKKAKEKAVEAVVSYLSKKLKVSALQLGLQVSPWKSVMPG